MFPIDFDNKQLSSGIFWVISDNYDLNNFKLVSFKIPCDLNGNPKNTHSIELNSKSGNNYNHKKLWDNEVKNNNLHKPYNKKDFNYYPRGRVEISNNKAVIYLNPHINKPELKDEIMNDFGIFSQYISEVRVITDGSDHYKCFLDWN